MGHGVANLEAHLSHEPHEPPATPWGIGRIWADFTLKRPDRAEILAFVPTKVKSQAISRNRLTARLRV
jgi:hypothetical protein